MLPITEQLCVLHLPTRRAEQVLAVLREQRREGPVLARQIRWSLLAHPDARPPEDVATELSARDIDIPGTGSAVMLPTSLGRWSREGCHWVRPPTGHDELPPLSLLLHIALSVAPQRVSTALSESGERGKFRYDRDGVGPR